MTRLIPIPFFLLAFLSSLVRAQESPGSSCPCTLQGTVVDSISGAPVRGALVESSNDTGSARGTLTDSQGAFQFEGLPAGSVSLMATKPGFLTSSPVPYLKKFSTFQVGPAVPPALIKLTPTGVIYGRVVDDHGDPLENFEVQLVRRAPSDGTPFLFTQLLGAHQPFVTDDRGNFRIPDLPPAAYFVLVGPAGRETYRSQDTPVPLGYSRVFYPGVTDLASASPLKVFAGRETQTNFVLNAKPLVYIAGSIVGYSPGSQVGLSVAETFKPAETADVHLDQQTGLFQTRLLPPGSYNLSAAATDSQSLDVSTATRTASQLVKADSNVSGLRLVLRPCVNISVNIHGLSLEEETERVMIFMHARGQGAGRQAMGLRAQDKAGMPPGDMHFVCVLSGTYWIEASDYGPNHAFYVESISSGSMDLLANDLVVGSSASISPIEVVFRKGAATLSGTVNIASSSHGALVCVIPPSPRKFPLFQIAENDGSFQFLNLSPGTYRIAVVDTLIDPDPGNQELMKKLSSISKEVSLAEGQSVSLTLDVNAVEE